MDLGSAAKTQVQTDQSPRSDSGVPARLAPFPDFITLDDVGWQLR